jgi:hypothetical protein
MKSALFPDRRFEEVQPMRIGVPFIFLPLTGYYLAPYFLISRHITLPPLTVALALCLYIEGIFFHYVGDGQKFYILRFKMGLIEDGLQRCLKKRPFAPIEALGFIAPFKTQRNEDCFVCIASCANAGSRHRICGLN